MKKRPNVYLLIMTTWLLLCIFGVTAIVLNIKNLYPNPSLFLLILLTINTIFITYFWLNGTKDIVYVVFYSVTKRKIRKIERSILEDPIPEMLKNAQVLLLYCTCDDFIEDSLYQSMQQTHVNTKTFILDDSSTDEFKERINTFAAKENVTVIRRENRVGFKAGNLNNFLNGERIPNYDYFVILDSDEIIPSDFIKDALHYFYRYPEMGILQATHISTRDHTRFMKNFSMGVNAHWPTYQTIKEKYGFLSFLGHGAMISKECFEEVGKFPELVAEDVCFSIEAKLNGYYTAFSNEIVCQEEFPIDYYAFKKRHLKWTGGNLEFIQNYAKKIFLTNKMTWYEKLDVSLFTFNLPMSSVFFLFLAINLIVFPWTEYSAGYPLWLMVPTTIYFLAPMTNDMVYLLGKISLWQYIKYIFLSFLLYGSLYWLSFIGATKSLFGVKAKFIVTPKEEKNYTVLEILKGNFQEILFAFVLIAISVYFTESFLPVILIAVPSLSGVFLTLLSRNVKKKNEEYDQKSVK